MVNDILKKAVIAAAIFMIFGEWGLRLFKDQVRVYYPAGRTFPPIFAESGTQGFALKPGADVTHYNYFNEFIKRYRINKEGFRGQTGDGDIVMAGDSFIFGIGLNDDETVPYRLQEMSGLVVTNKGVPGYSVDNEYIELKNNAAEKIAVVSFFLGNDIDDMRDHEWVSGGDGLPSGIVNRKIVVDRYSRLADKESGANPLKEFLRDNSYLYAVLSENRYKLKWKIEGIISKLKSPGRARPVKSPPVHFKEDEYVLKAKSIFRQMKKMRDRTLVLVIPSREPEVSEVELEKYMTDFFDKEGIDYMVIPNKPGSACYYKIDCHWTPEGAKFTASLVYNKLKSLCWL